MTTANLPPANRDAPHPPDPLGDPTEHFEQPDPITGEPTSDQSRDAAPPDQPNRQGGTRNNARINPALLITLADAAGCHLEERRANPDMATGICPFHSSYASRGARTLEINLSAGSFRCSQCNAQGDTPVFAALLWGMTVVEAREWLRDPVNATTRRPMPTRYETEPSRREPPRPQNTALLTRALPILEENLSNPRAIRFLTKLDIHHHEAQSRLRLGYCDNRSLRSHLERLDLEPYEIEQSPLFRGSQKHERFQDQLVIPDIDFIGSPATFVGVPILAPRRGTRWSAEPPDFTPLPGQRPFLLGRLRMPARSDRVLFTTDPRLYIVLRCHTQIPAVLQIGLSQPGTVANYLRYVRTNQVVILHHDASAGLAIAQELRQHRVENIPLSPRWMADQLDGNRRDLRPLGQPLENLSRLQTQPDEPEDTSS